MKSLQEHLNEGLLNEVTKDSKYLKLWNINIINDIQKIIIDLLGKDSPSNDYHTEHAGYVGVLLSNYEIEFKYDFESGTFDMAELNRGRRTWVMRGTSMRGSNITEVIIASLIDSGKVSPKFFLNRTMNLLRLSKNSRYKFIEKLITESKDQDLKKFLKEYKANN